MAEDVSEEDLAAARGAGEEAAQQTLAHGPDHPLLRVAWARGFGRVDLLQQAVDDAKAAGFTWKDIGVAVDQHWKTAATKYGGGYDAQRRYRQRRQSDG